MRQTRRTRHKDAPGWIGGISVSATTAPTSELVIFLLFKFSKRYVLPMYCLGRFYYSFPKGTFGVYIPLIKREFMLCLDFAAALRTDPYEREVG